MRLLFHSAILLVLVAYAAGEACVQETNCLLSSQCYCAAASSPIETDVTPQFVVLTFNDAITDLYYQTYYDPLLSGRTNPDGNPVSATFYVPHEYTDYSRVNDLYNSGYEIAIHTITKSSYSDYWASATVETLVAEFQGQKEIINTFANIPEEDLLGARVPNFELAGNELFDAYVQSGITYDNTWTTRHDDPYFPFSLEYESDMPCIIGSCPDGSYTGVWAAPIIDLQSNGVDCNNIQSCSVSGTAEEISDWLYEQFTDLYEDSHAPMTLVASAAWFLTSEDAFDGLADFLDRIAQLENVFLVSHKQVIDWMKNPVPTSAYSSAIAEQSASCTKRTCALAKDDEIRYMVSCAACPAVYPWLDNPQGEQIVEETEE